MLGPVKPRRLDESIAVPLEDLVPASNFYRHLEAKLDLSFVRDWTQELYAVRGRPSIDPVVFFKLQLVMFFEGIRSERKLIETASLNLAHRWYLGYALNEGLPDHSSLTRIRQRLGIDIFAQFFERIVDLCQEAGMVWGRELYFDGTKVGANADFDSLVPRFSHEAKCHVDDLFFVKGWRFDYSDGGSVRLVVVLGHADAPIVYMTSNLGYRHVQDRRGPGQLPDLLAETEWFAEELAESPGVVSTRELEDDDGY